MFLCSLALGMSLKQLAKHIQKQWSQWPQAALKIISKNVRETHDKQALINHFHIFQTRTYWPNMTQTIWNTEHNTLSGFMFVCFLKPKC